MGPEVTVDPATTVVAGARDCSSLDSEVATALSRHVQAKDVAALVGGSYDDRRRLALTVCVQVARRGLPVLIASPWETPSSLAADLVAVGGNVEEPQICLPGEEGSGGASVRVGEHVWLVSDHRQGLSILWRCAAEQARHRAQPVFGLVVVDHVDAFESFDDDLMRLRPTASVLGAPMLVIASKGSPGGAVVGAADVVVLIEERPVRESPGGTPPIWVGPAPKGRSKAMLVALERTGSSGLTLPFVLSSLERLGRLPDLTSRELRRDDDGAVLGWRVFDLSTPARGGARLQSPFRRTAWRAPVQTAKCDIRDHRAPDPDCDCGIYATTDLELAVSNARSTRGDGVVALVRGWGRVAIHSEGWRAEHAAPIAVFGTLLDDTQAELAYRYECETASSGRRRLWCISGTSCESRQSKSKTASTASPRRERPQSSRMRR